MTARLAVYLEDAAIAPHVLGGGLSRVNAALLAGVATDLAMVALVQTHGRYAAADWDPRFAAVTHALAEGLRKPLIVALRHGRALAAPATRLLLNPIVKAVRESGARWLFAPIGTDVGTAERAIVVARAAGLPVLLYIVDDIEAAAKASGTDLQTRARLNRAVRAADRVLAITPALAERLSARHGVKAAAMPLPFEPRPVPPIPGDDRSGDVLHIGAINHVYEPGLLVAARAIGALNARGRSLRLRLTARLSSEQLAPFAAYAPVVAAPFEGEGALEVALAGSLCALVPVLAEPSGMYATSFPSKLLEYWNAARRIVVLGPSDAAAAQRFAVHGLDHVAADQDALEVILAAYDDQRPDWRARYREALAADHAAAAIGAAIAAATAR